MSKRDVIWIEGERELFLNMQRTLDSNLSAARKALRTGGMTIVNDAKQNLRENGNIAHGHLRKSGRVQAVEGDADAIDAGFPMTYAYFVEYGRRSGKMPPISTIVEWLRKKASTSRGIKNAFESAAAHSKMDTEKYRRSFAFLIARSIGRNGTKPHPFFAPAVEKNKKAVTNAIQEALAKDINNGKQ